MEEDVKEFEKAIEFVEARIPGFEIRYKNKSWSSWLISKLVWIFNRRYMTDYTTTRYPKVYFPSREYIVSNPRKATKILFHEFVHLWDRQEQGVSFSFGYAFPQWLAIPNLVFGTLFLLVSNEAASWVGAGAGWVFGALCASPLASQPRTMAELRGYSMNMAINYWRYGEVSDGTKEWVKGIFLDWSYYKMCWSGRYIASSVDRSLIRIRLSQFGIQSIGGKNGLPFKLAQKFFEGGEGHGGKK